MGKYLMVKPHHKSKNDIENRVYGSYTVFGAKCFVVSAATWLV